jgi:hypothetical protein
VVVVDVVRARAAVQTVVVAQAVVPVVLHKVVAVVARVALTTVAVAVRVADK